MKTNHSLQVYQVALSMISGVGPVTAKKLIAYIGSVEGIFKEKQRTLEKIPGVGEHIASLVINQQVIDKAYEELEFIKKFKITSAWYLDDNYPQRLKECPDCPIILFAMGQVEWNAPKILSIVGTRSATAYGKEQCEKLILDLVEKGHKPIIVSGLAMGIDIAAHKAALKNNLQTIAVLGHGLKTVYPSHHKTMAGQIALQGALMTEFASDIFPDRPNFVRRNRIIAGLADATIVVESGETGGALITAEMANSYDREVMALPGRSNDPRSKGCNKLIKTQRADLIESVDDIEYIMGWDSVKNKPGAIQKDLFVQLTGIEQQVMSILKEHGELPIDSICYYAEMPVSKMSPLLLNLEFSGMVRSLPGKVYSAV